ncbi:alpha-hydroxy-acid oxidizing protein [Fusobacterium necrophorum]|uniref:Alpha-hydroxy-acid oxidizing protein n=1 Tax=Fusobacterium necrophorum TaxID=859 RepID=A0A4Q2KYF3_9FUSO|nr:alpha-hydroxy-acid oxidizing protein [Fusobacterium necrophorum]KYM42482.1 alpha-hydroxy-acid oxidizing enzyme [Fusobacterium necrophorum subsp. funduliforme]MDK4501971.1 alpha-hydroxy-acid oxidizing protein [Fusobacterium necrophorum]RXZ70684.1 alpha-hydroxy-acid oxidizing protein [Fusobacterium necrophorum]
MTLQEVYQEARGRMKGFCSICPECNGKVCAGKVPGMGGCGSGFSFQHNYTTLKALHLQMRCLHQVKDPKTAVEIFGQNLSMPILGAPITGTKFNFGGYVTQEEFCDDIILGAKAAGTLAMIGDTGDPAAYEAGIASLKKAKGLGIAIIKPRHNEEIIKRIRLAEEASAIAVGIDLDGAGLLTMKLFHQPVEPKSIEDLKILVQSTKLPFLVKGILSVEEAKACVEAGVHAIVVSNHGGRVLDDCISPVEVLQEIVKEVGDKIIVLADGNVRSGEDVLKYLSLGAKAVLVGRPCIWASVGNRQSGIETLFHELQAQLYKAMLMTGNASVNSIAPNTIFKNA